MRIVKRDRIRNDTSSLVLFTSVANNDISLFGTKTVNRRRITIGFTNVISSDKRYAAKG